MNNNFDYITVGDKVIISVHHQPDYIGTVERVTPKQFVAGGDYYHKHNGHRVGDQSSWYRRFAYPYNEKEAGRIAEEQSRREALRTLRLHNNNSFNDDELQRVQTIILECQQRIKKDGKA